MQPIALRIGISELLIILLYALACMNPFSLSCVRFAFGEFRFAFGEFRVCVLWGVTRLNGARGKKHVWAPMVEPEVFRKQLHCIEESTCDIFGTFRRPPIVIRTRGIVPALFPLVMLLCVFDWRLLGRRLCALTSFHRQGSVLSRGDNVLELFCSARRAFQALLFCCRAVVEVFSAAANQKPHVNKDLCTRKSVKRTSKRVRANTLLRLVNLKRHAVSACQLKNVTQQ